MSRFLVNAAVLTGIGVGLSCTPHRPAEIERVAPATTSPATRPMEPLSRPTSLPAFNVTDLKVQTLAGGTILSASEQTTYRTIETTIKKLTSDLSRAPSLGKRPLTGPMIFIYHHAPIGADAPFPLEIGCLVTPGTKAVGGLKIRELPALRAATVGFTGPMTAIDKAYDKLVKSADQAKLKLTGETREVYLRFDSPESLDNQVLIGIGIR